MEKSNKNEREHPSNRGRPPKLAYEQMAVLRTIVLEHRNATVEELGELLAGRTGVRVTHQTMYRYLAQARVQRGGAVGFAAASG
jgi:transposase